MAENTVGMTVGYAVENLFQVQLLGLLYDLRLVHEAVGPAVGQVPIGSTVGALG